MHKLRFLKLPVFILFVLIISVSSFAQAPATFSSADIYLQIKKLNVLGSVLYIAAHPDDENTRLIGYLSKEKLYRTGYLSLTRGDGGQNLIGDEQGIELGMIRTQELLSARRIDGGEQFFSRAYDFGYCKTADEALSTWGHDKILSDVVWMIRKFQPDVIITRFPGDDRAGHGHHWASALLAKEAYADAADPNKFPEQFKYGVKTWQAKRLLWNTFNFGSTNTTSADQFKIDVGVYNSLLGKSYGEIAAESRSQHKSQGFGVPRQRGQQFEYFKLTAGDAITDDLMNGVNTSWQRTGNDAIIAEVNNILSQFNFEHPENAVPALVNLYNDVQKTNDSYWRTQKLEEIKNIIVACSGLVAEATTTSEYTVPGNNFQVQLFINKRNNANISLKNISIQSFDSSSNAVLQSNQNIIITKNIQTPAGAKATQPYWLAKPLQSGSFDVNEQLLIGKGENDADFSASFTFIIEGTSFTVIKPVQYKFTDPVKGELYEPFRIINPLSIQTSPSVTLTNIVDGIKMHRQMIDVSIKSNITASSLPVSVYFNQDSKKIKIKDTVLNVEAGKQYAFQVPLKRFYDGSSNSSVFITVEAVVNGSTQIFSDELKSIKYDHIPYIDYNTTDKIKVISDEVKTVGKKIGYIAGAGDKVAQDLEEMGFTVTMLDEKDITDDNLKKFDAVITGIRAYNVHEWLSAKYDILMNYIKNGGNMIVQYNTNNFISSVPPKIGPYNFSISRTRVTDEHADVKILTPDHPALKYPNIITQKDFEGWIQERSIYQAENIDNNYTAPFGMNDANETQSNGSLIIAKYGKGNFVYTGLVFFRELPAGVAGAYRLMANLIALPMD